MASEELVFNEERVLELVDKLDKYSNDLERIFNNIYRLQEDFKKHFGGTYFTSRFVPKKEMDIYVNELKASKNWLQKHYEDNIEAKRQIVNAGDGLGSHAPTQNTNMDTSNKNNTNNQASLSKDKPEQPVLIDEGESEDTLSSSRGGTVGLNSRARIIPKVSVTIPTSAPAETIEPSTNTSNLTVENFINTASDYHSKLVKEGGWTWSSAGLFYNDIKSSTYHPRKLTCCATYVASILYLGGIFTEEEINSKEGWNYNHPEGIKKLCVNHNWEKISNPKDVKAGDIVFYWDPKKKNQTGHVMIYAGDGKWYNGGSTASLRQEAPVKYGPPSGNFAFAYRMPSNNQ